MRYSDVAEKYYKDTKKRILENVLAAENNSSERSRTITIGEKSNIENIENEEINIMTNNRMTNNGAKIRNSKGIIAAACAVVVMGSGVFALNSMKAANSSNVSSRPESLKDIVVTADEDSASETSENEKNDDTAKVDEKKEEISRVDVKEKKDSSTAEVKEKNDSKTEAKENTSGNAETNNNSTPSNDQSDVIDRGGHAHALNDETMYNDRNYQFDEDNYVSVEFDREIDDATIICGATVTSRELYGVLSKFDVRPISEFNNNELENINTLEYKCTVKFDGQWFKGTDLMDKLSQVPQYNSSTGELEVMVPLGRKITDDDDNGWYYASKQDEIEFPELCSVGEKVMLKLELNDFAGNIGLCGEDVFIYDNDDKMYHSEQFYVTKLGYEGSYEYKESMNNYLLNTFKGGTVEKAEQWVSYLGDTSIIKRIPSKRFSSGQVAEICYSLPDNCFVIFVAE
ncbi:hypothetical protein [uncultured Ruminococcus sp.]|uniref:hypothetical protein n=1 Tax=uncultured Ruminococcus sp. TaxID=165186 RepID=UPI0025DDB13A|nr:hypothetical protein [uncultured Ruminococcus sp.]